MSAFIVLGVLALCGLIAAIEIIRNRRIRSSASFTEPNRPAPVIYLPADIEKEKRRRNIL